MEDSGMDAWKPKLTMKEKIFNVVREVAGCLACLVMIELLMIMFVVFS